MFVCLCVPAEHHSPHHDIEKVARRPRQSPYPMLSFDDAIKMFVCLFVSDEHHSPHHDIEKVARRPRQSPYPMLSFDDAIKTVMENASVMEKETIACKGIVYSGRN